MATCLVIIDVQRGFVGPETDFVPDRILELAGRGGFDHVVATRFMNYEGSPYMRFIGWSGLLDEESQRLYPGIDEVAERVFDKNVYTCFTREFSEFVREGGITELFFVGIDTDCCVLKSAVDAFEQNMTCHVLTHYCASNGGVQSHEAGIKVLERTIGPAQLDARL